ncbi:transcriptional regulator [Streptomyces sp. NBC_01571]|uniref:transcriptional regulator n=1 Tax=Streptomyces sp. NBC_01571 TaxID=2975883 RepID=UPI0022583FD1|nr:transcriptional regulator [Streptomyces sp. NBC_01571]MCX4579042.1 transcriptional regulator [Streptomyces sp. NBC_01571]
MPYDVPTPHYTQQPSSQPEAVTGTQSQRQGLAQLPRAAADLVLLGDLTGRYSAGSYSKLDRQGQVVQRDARTGIAEHGHRITAAIACHVARVGGTVNQLTDLLMHPDHEGGRHAQNIALRSGQARALAYIERVWESASATVSNTAQVVSRQDAHEDLAALRDRIEVTPWRSERGRTALRVLRAHLNFAEAAGGRLHAASERQAAEEAGISRQAVRNAYDTVLKPGGWLRRLRVGRGKEGSAWYLGNGPGRVAGDRLSHSQTTQFPPDPALDEWSTPETALSADIDSTVISRLMAHDAFAHRALGSSALLIIGALHSRPAQTVGELVITSSVSRATVYRTLHRLGSHGLVHHVGEIWILAPRALEGFGNRLLGAVTEAEVVPSRGWDEIASHHGTAGLSSSRRTFHAAERAMYRAVLGRLAEHRSTAHVIVRDGRQVLIPAPRPDEVLSTWQAPGGCVLDPVTGRAAPDWRIATDGRLILITPADQRSYDELTAAHAEALSEWESAA